MRVAEFFCHREEYENRTRMDIPDKHSSSSGSNSICSSSSNALNVNAQPSASKFIKGQEKEKELEITMMATTSETSKHNK